MTETFAIGLDIGGTNTRAALVSSSAQGSRVLDERRVRSREDTSPGRIARTVGELVEACCAGAQIPRDRLSSIGIGIAGQLSRDQRTVINGPNLGWREVPFADLIEASVGPIPTRIFNDLSVIAWGEAQCGGGRGHDDLLVIYVGTGVGCGLILNSALYEGSHAKAGEVGHSKITASGGRPCGCGEFGCLETLIGGRYIEGRVIEDLNAGLADDLRAFLELSPTPEPGSVVPSDIDRAAIAGVDYASKLWDEAASSFGLVMSACLAVTNPSGWLLGGGVMEGCPELRRLAVSYTQRLTVKAIWDDLEVLTPQLGSLSGLLGAALLSL